MSRTSDEIVAEMLDSMPEQFDKSPGSVVYDMQRPTSIEIAALEADQDEILDNAFFETADDEHKEIIAQDRAGVTRKPPTYAHGFVTITGTPGTEVPEGLLVASDYFDFEVTEAGEVGDAGSVTVPVACTTVGEMGNVPAGSIYEFNVTQEGLFTVTNAEPIAGGYEIESIEDFSDRYYAIIQLPSGSGNRYDYERWAREVDGVGEAKCFPRTPTIGSVTTYITDRTHRAAGAALRQEVYDYIEEKRPCPATSIIAAPTEVEANFSVTVTVASGSPADYAAAIEDALEAYVLSIGFHETNRRISYALASEAVLSVSGVTDLTQLLINGAADSVALGETELATMGDVEVS